MPKKRMETNWEREIGTDDLNPALKRYARYLEEIGLRDSTISSYVFRVGKFLEFAQDDAPIVEDFTRFRETLQDKRLSRSLINNYCFAIKRFYELCGKTIDFNFMRPMNTIPYFFDENDILKIFAACYTLSTLRCSKIYYYIKALKFI